MFLKTVRRVNKIRYYSRMEKKMDQMVEKLGLRDKEIRRKWWINHELECSFGAGSIGRTDL